MSWRGIITGPGDDEKFLRIMRIDPDIKPDRLEADDEPAPTDPAQVDWVSLWEHECKLAQGHASHFLRQRDAEYHRANGWRFAAILCGVALVVVLWHFRAQ
jgi:hypothetical protein